MLTNFDNRFKIFKKANFESIFMNFVNFEKMSMVDELTTRRSEVSFSYTVTPPDQPQVLDLFAIEHVVCLGRFVESQVKATLRKSSLNHVKVHFLVHPSPASPVANSGWDKIAYKTFEDIGLLNVLTND